MIENNGRLRDLWTAQLYREHRNISSYHRLPLRTPVIVVCDLGKKWGTWDSFYEVISINQNLICNHSWDIVLEVFKHEMAHQYVSQVLGLEEHHGPAFQEACRKLGLAPWSAKASGELPESIPPLKDRLLSTEDEKLLNRVEKLLALAQSANEHEALLAMQKVQEIYGKHNLDRIQLKRDANMDSLTISFKKKRVDHDESMIISILVKHFFVRVVYTNLYDAEQATEFKSVELLGATENLLMAEYVYYFLRGRVNSLWDEYLKANKVSRRLRRSYILGVLKGFDEKLQRRSADSATSGRSEPGLMKIKDPALEQYVKHRYPRLAKRSTSGSQLDTTTFQQGQSDGRSITLNKGISRRGSGSGGYLTS
jgi:hypothetical protein